MFKKTFATAAVVCAVPALASASWFLSTQAKSAGGTITTTVNGVSKSQDWTKGPVFNTYTTSAGVTVTVTPDDGFVISGFNNNGKDIQGVEGRDAKGWPLPPLALGAQTFTITGDSTTDKDFSATFSPTTYTITATMTGGSVTPASVKNLYKGYELTSPLTFTFSPAPGSRINSLTGVPTDPKVTVTNPGGVNQRATVTFAAGYKFGTAGLNMAAVAINESPYLDAILAKTAVLGDTTPVTLKANANNVPSESYTWKYVSGPANQLPGTTGAVWKNGRLVSTTDVTPGPAIAGFPADGLSGKEISFTVPTKAGQYLFQVTAKSLDGKITATSLATLNVIAQADVSKQCDYCHTANGLRPASAALSTSVHRDDTKVQCADCHVGAHPGGSASTACAICHTSVTTGFQASNHWITVGNAGYHYDTDPLKPNEEAVEPNCIYRCHFKATDFPTGTVIDGTADNTVGTGYGCTTCHGGTLGSDGNVTVPTEGHKIVPATVADTCYVCHSGSKHGGLPNEFFNSKHWQNDFEYGPEFANQMVTTVSGGTVSYNGTQDGVLNPNDGYTTTEDGATVTCAYRCHFRPGMGPSKNVTGYLANGKATTYVEYNDTLNGVTYTRPGGDSCNACHDSHNLKASYQTCLSCHTGSKHGKVPNEFFASKHWQNSTESGPEFKNQLNATVAGGNVKLSGTSDGILEPNDSYQTYENAELVTCAYRCHFRPGMGEKKNIDGYLAKGKATTYVTYSSPYTGTKYNRPGGDACLACHDAHGLEATARSTCYTCHSGGKHGWSVKAFEKSSHYTGQYAVYEGIGGENGKACTACHNAHSLEAVFFTYSAATTYNAQVKGAVGCQSCHTPGETYSIYDANRVGKAPHFQIQPANAFGYYTSASYITDNPAYSNSCADCHSHNNTINKGWAAGGHGDVKAIPWKTTKDDDWNRGTVVSDYKVSAQKTDCQRCHTAKGFAQFWDSGFADITQLGGKSSAPLVCSGCHSNVDKGTVRKLPAGFSTGVKTFVGYSTVAYSTKKSVTFMQFPDLKNSNVCIPCHAGRGTGELIKEVFKTPSATPWMIGTRIYAHFASAAGVVNGSSAYEFTTPTTTNTHGSIGLANNGTQGPCVACHMTTKATAGVPNMSHSVKTIDFGTESTPGAFLTDACKACHADMTVADVAAKKDQFNAALQVLRNLLLQKGITGLQDEIMSRPGERQGQDMRGNADSLALISSLNLDQVQVAERNTGAAFNWWLFATSSTGVAQGDVAAYVHNPGYVRQVIADSIDWMDDYQLNGSAKATIDAMKNQPQPTFDGVTDGVVIDSATAALATEFVK